MSKRVQEFLDAFALLEDVVRAKFDGEGYKAFRKKVSELAAQDPLFSLHKKDLDLFAELRNVLVHRRVEGKYLAEPAPEVTNKLTRIVEKLRHPPRMVDHFQVEIREFTKQDTMRTVYGYLYDKDFSQVFVRNEEQVLMCLSARTMQRWAASKSDDGLVDLETTVGEALMHSEYLDELSFLPRTATVIDAQRYFGNKDTPFQVAVIASQTGKPTEKPLALVTAWDLGRIEGIMSGEQI